MTREEIEKMVSSYIEQSRSGLSVENSKFDFKREWYDLKLEEGIQEFIKDTTSMVNTYGPDGLIVIGFDDKSKEFVDSTLPIDPSNIVNLVNKRVDRLFEINTYDIVYQGYSLSVIHIPPSMDKPHVIRNYKTFHKDGKEKNSYQNVTLVRKNSRTDFSTRYDLDLMLWDNKNVEPEYRIISSCDVEFLNFRQDGDERPKCRIYLTLENIGRRPVGISKISITFKLFEDSSPDEEMVFQIDSTGKNIIIPVGNIWNHDVEMILLSSLYKPTTKILVDKFEKGKKHLISTPLLFTLSTGKTFESELIRI